MAVAASIEEKPTRPGRILVVDDIADNRDLLTRRLRREGYSDIETAEDGEEALAAIEARPFDLVLLDVMMPKCDGYQVLERLKAQGRLHLLPVIVVSALNEMESAIRCIQLGAVDFLSKPIDVTLLRARVNASLEMQRLRTHERRIAEALRLEKERSEQLLRNILPKEIVCRLNESPALIADLLPNVTILFADIVGFTMLASQVSAEELVRLLNRLFCEFDRLALGLGVEKIKTIGDAYMAIGGLPEPRADHAHAVADLALAMLEAVELINRDLATPLRIRIGIHSGEVVAGVIGMHKFAYDVWGEAVNIASRMESQGVPDRIHISAGTRLHLENDFRCEPHRTMGITGRAPMQTYFLLGRTGETE